MFSDILKNMKFFDKMSYINRKTFCFISLKRVLWGMVLLIYLFSVFLSGSQDPGGKGNENVIRNCSIHCTIHKSREEIRYYININFRHFINFRIFIC